jgi:type VI protein secretion system component VasF
VDRTLVPLAPDAETSLQLRVMSPAGALRGTVERITLTVLSRNDANQRADFVATARISDPLGLGGIQKYVVWIVVLGIALIVIVILVDHAKSRKFRGHIR